MADIHSAVEGVRTLAVAGAVHSPAGVEAAHSLLAEEGIRLAAGHSHQEHRTVLEVERHTVLAEHHHILVRREGQSSSHPSCHTTSQLRPAAV